MNRHEGYPGIQLFRESGQILRLGEEGLNQHPEEAYQDGQLNYQWPQATHRADAGFPVQAHGFLGDPGPVAAVPLLDFPHPGLKGAHPPHLVNLLQREGKGNQPYQNSEGDDCQAHITEAEHIQHQQGVEHGPDDYFIPD